MVWPHGCKRMRHKMTSAQEPSQIQRDCRHFERWWRAMARTPEKPPARPDSHSLEAAGHATDPDIDHGNVRISRPKVWKVHQRQVAEKGGTRTTTAEVSIKWERRHLCYRQLEWSQSPRLTGYTNVPTTTHVGKSNPVRENESLVSYQHTGPCRHMTM